MLQYSEITLRVNLEYLPHHGAKNFMKTVLPSVSLWNVSGVSSRAVIVVVVDAAKARRAADLIIIAEDCRDVEIYGRFVGDLWCLTPLGGNNSTCPILFQTVGIIFI